MMKHLPKALLLALLVGGLGAQGLQGIRPAVASPSWSSYCGPESSPGGSVIWNGLLYPWSRLFDSSCQTHDANYSLANKGDGTMTQARADSIFLADMQRKCNQQWKSVVGLNGTAGEIASTVAQILSLGTFGLAMEAWCSSAAQSNYLMVTTLGEDVGAVRGFPSISITQATIRRIYNRFSDDEIEVAFTVSNNGNVNIEVDAVLMRRGKGYRDLVKPGLLGSISNAFNSDIIDGVPNTHEVDLRSGQRWSNKVTTDGFWASQENLGSNVDVFIRSDLYNPGGNFKSPFVPMAWLRCPKPSRSGSAACIVQYRFGDGWSSESVRQKADQWVAHVRSSSGVGSGSRSLPCNDRPSFVGVWSFRNPADNKFARGGVTAEGRNDVVGALGTEVNNPQKAWETFRLYSIPGVDGGRRIQNTIDGQWLEAINSTGTLTLPTSAATCRSDNKGMQWRVVSTEGRTGVFKLQSLNTNRFVRIAPGGLLKADASQAQATEFIWQKYE